MNKCMEYQKKFMELSGGDGFLEPGRNKLDDGITTANRIKSASTPLAVEKKNGEN